jgi:D-beta-D-heptose 7-phosphate kinase/D-beta-D-heptose 1-phosphate adenosyltransferase
MKPEVERLQSARIMVVGDVMLDRYWTGSTNRISPEAPVPVVRIAGTEDRAGGAANVAANAVAVGAAVTLVGLIGDDADGDRLQECCAAAGIEARLQRAAERTTVKLRVLAQHHQLLRLDFETIPVTERLVVTPEIAALVPQTGAVVLSDYAKGALLNPANWIELARHHGKPVIVDPKSRDFGRYAGADLITPNSAEFEAVVGHCDSEAELAARGRALCRAHGLGAVLVTRGERGMSLVRADGEPLHLSAQARDVFDVTGAGDTVCAIVASALAAGSDLATATMLANAAAGLVVGKLGTAVVSNAELKAAVSPEHHPVPAILDERQLLEEVAAARARGERIVMTNGCFDIVHAGHVRYLEQSAALGDRLLIAVNSDASVRRLKGPTRPVNSLRQRLEVLAGLRAVDWVVPFDEDTPQRLIAALGPDVLVKGGDYRIADIAGAEDVLRRGGRVLTLPYHDGLSTTRIIDAARKRPEESA